MSSCLNYSHSYLDVEIKAMKKENKIKSMKNNCVTSTVPICNVYRFAASS